LADFVIASIFGLTAVAVVNVAGAEVAFIGGDDVVVVAVGVFVSVLDDDAAIVIVGLLAGSGDDVLWFDVHVRSVLEALAHTT
jgi:hypothetical protein